MLSMLTCSNSMASGMNLESFLSLSIFSSRGTLSASFAEVREAVGVEPGAVCPIMRDIGLFVDRKVMELEKINFGLGDHMYGLEIRAGDLEKVVWFRVVDVAKTEF